MSDPRLFDVQAAAEYLRSIGASSVTIKFIRGLISSGQIPHLRIGKKFYLTRAQIDLWLEKHDRRSR
jgi:excisionase family DNA binding protein